MNLTIAEENYLKCIYKLYLGQQGSVSTNAIASQMNTKAASVTDMIQKLAEKELILYVKYRGVKLKELGMKLATQLIRKHRLWETFLVKKLHYSWDEVHDIAEQLEHVKSDSLVDRLDVFLDFPRYDPHGDPIPDKNGKITLRNQIGLNMLKEGDQGVFVGVKEHQSEFLLYLNKLQLAMGSKIGFLSINSYDGSVNVRIDEHQEVVLSEKVAEKILVQKTIL